MTISHVSPGPIWPPDANLTTNRRRELAHGLAPELEAVAHSVPCQLTPKLKHSLSRTKTKDCKSKILKRSSLRLKFKRMLMRHRRIRQISLGKKRSPERSLSLKPMNCLRRPAARAGHSWMRARLGQALAVAQLLHSPTVRKKPRSTTPTTKTSSSEISNSGPSRHISRWKRITPCLSSKTLMRWPRLTLCRSSQRIKYREKPLKSSPSPSKTCRRRPRSKSERKKSEWRRTTSCWMASANLSPKSTQAQSTTSTRDRTSSMT
mmetsp:Transcript_13838/g.17540  ORF Transcript_13838/g.17540 Transcript_13838/m.17540 type:complete len:263 (+) Transcript_13838:546-1334(+)